MPRPSTGHLDFGAVFGRTFSIWMKNLVPFTILSVLMYLPWVIWQGLATPITASVSFFSVAIMTPMILQSLGGSLATAVMTYGVFSQLRGRPADLGQCVSVGLSRLIPVLFVGLIFGLIVAVGLVLLIIPGVIFLTMFYVAIPTAVIEKPGIFGALSRSNDLTKGNRMTIFALVLVLGLIAVLPGIILTMAGVSVVVVSVLGAVLGPISAVASAIVYNDLRALKEGIGVDELAAVFD